jgi:hypothetical protein
MRRLPFLIVMLAALLASPAHAEMEVGMQDDNAVVYGYSSRVIALDQFVAMGGTSVRMNLEHQRNHDYDDNLGLSAVRPGISYYDDALKDILARGLKPQITLIWKQQNNPRKIAKWIYNVAHHFGNQVDRYSVLNEPDLLLEIGCNKHNLARFTARFQHNLLLAKHDQYRAQVLTSPRGMNLTTACSRYRRGRFYSRLLARVVPAIHAANADAQVLAGETSAQPGLDWFVRGADPRTLPVDGWAHHPFQLRDLTPGRPTTHWSIGNLDLLKSILHMPIYFTEFGYPHPHSSMDKRVYGHRITPEQVAHALPRAWALARRGGAREMTQYQWFLKPAFRTEFWETALNNHQKSKVTPAYKALRALIKRWNRD